MLHVRKALSKQEEAEHEEWKKKHELANKKKLRELRQGRSKAKADESFWANQRKQLDRNLALHRGGHQLANSVDTGVTGAVALKKLPMINKEILLDRDQLEAMKQREALAAEQAKEKLNRIAPAYNKGPLTLYSEEEFNSSVKTGANRRRN